jgi:hypothetical protein
LCEQAEVDDRVTVRVGQRLPAPPEDLPDAEWFTDELATTDPDLSDGVPNAAIGDVDAIPPEVLEHIAAPLDFSTTESELSDEASDNNESWMSPQEKQLNAKRRQLVQLFPYRRVWFAPLVTVPTFTEKTVGRSNSVANSTSVAHSGDSGANGPISEGLITAWCCCCCCEQTDIVGLCWMQTTPYGREGQYRVLVIAGNGHGAAGFGIGTHETAEMATKYALRRAIRDMVSIGTHNGQLYHDLMGRKYNHKVLIRART